MSDIVLQWENLENKIVTAKDKRVGRITETSDNSLVIQDRGRFKYNVPKFHIGQVQWLRSILGPLFQRTKEIHGRKLA